jgi:hypothetical protein
MRKVLHCWIAVVVAFGLSGMVAAQAQSFPLGDYGHLKRKDKPDNASSATVYDNDNLPSTDTVSIVGSMQEPDTNHDAAERAGVGSAEKHVTDQEKRDEGRIEVGQSLEDRQKAFLYWQKRINKRKDKVEQLARELEDLRQNAPLSVVVLHLWPDDQLYLQSVNGKRRDLEQAKTNLNTLEDQARKAGVPSRYRDAEVKTEPPQTPDERKKAYSTMISQQQSFKARVLSSNPDAEAEPKDTDDQDSPTKEQAPKEKKDAGEIKLGQSPQERQKAYAYWERRVEDKEHRIDQLTGELDNLKQNLPAAVILHLWPEDKIYLQTVIDKQKELDQGKADLGDLQEQCRRRGVPTSFTH